MSTIIAYFDSSHDFPEEIISAAGFVPYKILGDIHQTNEPADRYMPNFFCPAAKSWFTEAMARSSEWKGIIVAQGCNSTNRHFDIWKMHIDTPFLYWFNGPLKDDHIAAKFFKNEIRGLIKTLEDQFSCVISNENIREAISQSNAIKSRLQKLSSLRSERDITNREYLDVVINALQNEKNETITALDLAIRDWSNRAPFPAGKKKVLLTGSDITYREWMDTLDECDIRVVRDDLSIGERYFATLIPDNEDPIDSLVAYYLGVPKPATKPGIGKRIDYLMKVLRETECDGIISQNLKFCEPFAYDSVTVNNTLKDHHYKLIHFEREFTPVTDHQMMNRLTAFTETL